ncbi:MAG: alginate export family protein [Acidobacteriaceae bacterium]
MRRTAFLIALFFTITIFCPAQSAPKGKLPFSVNVYDRTRADAWQWFAAPPTNNTYGYLESLVRIGVAQRIQHWDWMLEVAQPSILDAPTDAVAPVLAQGQLGLGGTYYAANGNNDYPAAAFLKQGHLRYHFNGADKDLRLGRFEFFDGLETKPKDPELGWLQANRIAQRLVGNFGFSNAQRSFDGMDGHYGQGDWDVTAMAGRADQGVFNMNGNPELNVDIQYLAFSKYQFQHHFLWRAFGIGYHDGRTGVLKVDNRPLAVRKADHKNIRIGTYGGDFLTDFPAGPGQMDLMAWGVWQTGNWGTQEQSSGAAAVEGGYQFRKIATAPWVRGGWDRSTGDDNPNDNQHKTFFQILPTPRIYARFPFYNLMNNQDTFVQVVDRPAKRLELRSDVHWLQLSAKQDLWYLSGGAFDNKVFGYVGRPSNGHASFASVADISADWQATHTLALNFYYANAWGKSVISSIYPKGNDGQFGYMELVYHWGEKQRAMK